MMRTKILLLLLLLLSFSFAQDKNMSEYVSDITGELEDTGDHFIQTGRAIGVGGANAIGSMFSAFETGDCGEAWAAEDPIGTVGAWLGPVALAATLVAFVIAIIYIVGQFLNSPPLIATAKDEIYQILITIARVVFIAGVILGINYWFSVASYGATDDVYADVCDSGGCRDKDLLEAAMAFSRKMVVELTKTYSGLVLFNMIVHTLYTATMWVGTDFRSMYNFNLGPVLKPFIDLIGMGLQSLSLAMGEWIAHMITLCFIRKWAFSFFLPVGILLRAIPQTRDVGEAIFMLVLALATIYPFMFIVDYEAHKLLQPYLADPMVQVRAMASKMGLFAIAGISLGLMFFGGGVIVPVLGGVIAMGAFELMKNAVYYVIIMSVLLPFLNIFITLTLAREWAKVFNVNVNYLSFMKII